MEYWAQKMDGLKVDQKVDYKADRRVDCSVCEQVASLAGRRVDELVVELDSRLDKQSVALMAHASVGY